MRLYRVTRLPELEIHEYINAFKTSSDRARYVIYISVVVSLLILISTWNTTELSWSRRRLEASERDLRSHYEDLYAQQTMTSPSTTPTSAKPQATPLARLDRERFVDRQVRQDRSIRYRDAALPRIWFVPIPGLGVNIHVNDLGVLGGLTLVVLSGLLCLSMVRQHENLYLALFKVRRLCEVERVSKHDGESMSNFLYHALAMGQVLNYPPTLARWGYGIRNQLAGLVRWTVLCLPAIVQAVVVIYNMRTFKIAIEAWGTIAYVRLVAQLALLAAITLACLLAGIYSRACNFRWRAAFQLINPGLARIQPRPWLDWVRLRWSRDAGPTFLLAELTYSFQPTAIPQEPAECATTAESHLDNITTAITIQQKDLACMAKKLRDDAESKIGKRGVDEIEQWEVKSNTVKGNAWKVKAICRYRPE